MMTTTFAAGGCPATRLRWRGGLGVAMMALGLVSSTGAAQVTERQVAAALQLLPPDVRDGAAVLVQDGSTFRTLRQGSGVWACRVWTVRDERLAANCHHQVLEALLNRSSALNEEGLRGTAVFEALARDVANGTLTVPSGAVEINASGAIPHPDSVPEVMTGNHFLYFPFATPAEVGIPDQPGADGQPWLHYAGTAKAHLMWPKELRPSAGGGS